MGAEGETIGLFTERVDRRRNHEGQIVTARASLRVRPRLNIQQVDRAVRRAVPANGRLSTRSVALFDDIFPLGDGDSKCFPIAGARVSGPASSADWRQRH